MATLKLERPKPSEADPTMLKQLVEFGYPMNLAEKALIETRNVGLQPAVDCKKIKNKKQQQLTKYKSYVGKKK